MPDANARRPSRIDSPEYVAAREHVRRSVSRSLGISDRTYDTIERIITSGMFRASKVRGLSRAVIVLSLLLLAKALKTHRAVRATVLEGCGQDAAVLIRSLFEATTAVMWILQKNSRHRTALFLAHQDQRTLVHVEAMSKTRGLKRAAKPLLARAQKNVSAWAGTLSAAELASVRKHWSGLPGGIEATARSLGRGWLKAYNTVYRETSSYAHGSDTAHHAFFSRTAPLPKFKLLPGDEGAQRNLVVAAMLLHGIARRMDERMQLEHSAAIAAIGAELKAWRPQR